jgi:hypothetical protein
LRRVWTVGDVSYGSTDLGLVLENVEWRFSFSFCGCIRRAHTPQSSHVHQARQNTHTHTHSRGLTHNGETAHTHTQSRPHNTQWVRERKQLTHPKQTHPNTTHANMHTNRKTQTSRLLLEPMVSACSTRGPSARHWRDSKEVGLVRTDTTWHVLTLSR